MIFTLTKAQAAEVVYVLEVHDCGTAHVEGRTLIVPADQLDAVAWACGNMREVHADNGATSKERMMARVCDLLREAGGRDSQSDDRKYR